MRNLPIIATLFLACLLAPPALAQTRCQQTAVHSDNPYAESGRQEMLCRHDTLTQTVTGIEEQARFGDLSASVQRQNLERRLDALPPPPRTTFWP